MSTGIITVLTLTVLALVGAESFVTPFSSRNASVIVDITSFEDLVTLQRSVQLPAILFIYDSVDVNSIRVVPEVEQGGRLLTGFAKVFAVDIRISEVAFALDSWDTQIVPSLFGLGTKFGSRKSFENSQLAGLGGVRSGSLLSQQKQITAENIKKFGIDMLTDEFIHKIDMSPKLEPLLATAESTKRQPFVILLTDKSASTALYKALSTKYRERAQFFEVNAKKASKAASLFGVDQSPALLVYDVRGNKHVYEGKLHPDEISSFFHRFMSDDAAAAAERQVSDINAIRRESLRILHPLYPIQRQDDWEHLVLNQPSVTGIFVGPASEQNRLNALVAAFLNANPKSTVTQFVFLVKGSSAVDNYLEVASGGGGEEGDVRLYFFSTKKSTITRFLGTLDVKALDGFVQGSLARGVGARKIELGDLPRFHVSA